MPASELRSTNRPMRLQLVVDCGSELFPGHRFVVTGLSDDGSSSDNLTSGPDEGRQAARMASVVFELVPGAEASELPADDEGGFPVEAAYGADVPLAWSTGGTGPDGSGGPMALEMFAGGPSTGGDFGPWPIPEDAR